MDELLARALQFIQLHSSLVSAALTFVGGFLLMDMLADAMPGQVITWLSSMMYGRKRGTVRINAAGQLVIPYRGQEYTDKLWGKTVSLDMLTDMDEYPAFEIMMMGVIVSAVLGAFLALSYREFHLESLLTVMFVAVILLVVHIQIEMLVRNKRLDKEFVAFLEHIGKALYRGTLYGAYTQITDEYLAEYAALGKRAPLYRNHVLRRFIYYFKKSSAEARRHDAILIEFLRDFSDYSHWAKQLAGMLESLNFQVDNETIAEQINTYINSILMQKFTDDSNAANRFAEVFSGLTAFSLIGVMAVVGIPMGGMMSSDLSFGV